MRGPQLATPLMMMIMMTMMIKRISFIKAWSPKTSRHNYFIEKVALNECKKCWFVTYQMVELMDRDLQQSTLVCIQVSFRKRTCKIICTATDTNVLQDCVQIPPLSRSYCMQAIGTHDNVICLSICLSVRLSVTLCIVAKWYILQQKWTSEWEVPS